jgi:hypothetical protein
LGISSTLGKFLKFAQEDKMFCLSNILLDFLDLKLLRTEEIVRPKDFFSRRFQEEPKCQEVKD